MITVKSKTDYTKRELISDVEIGYRVTAGTDDVLIANKDFRNCKYGILGYDGPQGKSRNIRVENCTFENDANSEWEGTLFYGNGAIDYGRLFNCRQSGARLVLTGASIGWIIRDCYGEYSHDSDIYVKGFHHKVIGNTVFSAGKDGMKCRVTKCGSGGGNIFIGNTIVDYALTELDAGGALNIATDHSIATGNFITINPIAEPMPSKHYNCINLAADNCKLNSNILVYPDGKIYHGVNDQGQGNSVE